MIRCDIKIFILRSKPDIEGQLIYRTVPETEKISDGS